MNKPPPLYTFRLFLKFNNGEVIWIGRGNLYGWKMRLSWNIRTFEDRFNSAVSADGKRKECIRYVYLRYGSCATQYICGAYFTMKRTKSRLLLRNSDGRTVTYNRKTLLVIANHVLIIVFICKFSIFCFSSHLTSGISLCAYLSLNMNNLCIWIRRSSGFWGGVLRLNSPFQIKKNKEFQDR